MRTNVRQGERNARWIAAGALTAALLTACGRSPRSSAGWAGTIDTTASGMIVVHNPKTGIWDSSTAWKVVEEHRIGTVTGTGPDLFGNIGAIEVDGAGRVYVLDSQTQDIRVFDSTGAYVRTIGRHGRGPGEFSQAIGMAWGRAGRLWVVDPQNNRVSVFDTTGSLVTDHPTAGGFAMMPWPGTIDTAGRFYTVVPDFAGEGFTFELVAYDTSMKVLDTIAIPKSPRPGEFFEIHSAHGSARASVPFAPGVSWQLTRDGAFWIAQTGQYRLVRRTLGGDTTRTIERDFDPVQVTSEDRDRAIASLAWFTKQGGKVDPGRIPDVKPALIDFFVDDHDNLWVMPYAPRRSEDGFLIDVFDSTGIYLGRVHLPFKLERYPRPIVRRDHIYSVVRNDLGVEFVVIARIVRP